MHPLRKRVERQRPRTKITEPFVMIEVSIIHKAHVVGPKAFAVYVVLRSKLRFTARPGIEHYRFDKARMERGEDFTAVSVLEIANELGTSDKSVMNALDTLEGAGWVTSSRPDRHCSKIYVLGIHGVWFALTSQNGMSGPPEFDSGKNAQTSQNGMSSTPDSGCPAELPIRDVRIGSDQIGDQIDRQIGAPRVEDDAAVSVAPKTMPRYRKAKLPVPASAGTARSIEDDAAATREARVTRTPPTPPARVSFRAPAPPVEVVPPTPPALPPPEPQEARTPPPLPSGEGSASKRFDARPKGPSRAKGWTGVVDPPARRGRSRKDAPPEELEVFEHERFGKRSIAREERAALEAALAKRDRQADEVYGEGNYTAVEAVAYYRALFANRFGTEDLGTTGPQRRVIAARLFAQRVADRAWGDGSSQRVFRYLRDTLLWWSENFETREWRLQKAPPSFDMLLREKGGGPSGFFTTWAFKHAKGE